MLLHQGAEEDGESTRGAEFIRAVRRLGYDTARTIEQALTTDSSVPEPLPPDPFLDAAEEAATRQYLGRVGRAIVLGEAWPEDVREYLEKLAAPVFSDDAED